MKARVLARRSLSGLTALMLAGTISMTSAWAAYDGDYDNVFTFTDSGVSAENSSGFKVSGTDLTINASGTYVVTGECVEGSITVKKGTTGVVLVLDDLTLTSSTTAPLSINKGSEATVVISGTSTLTDAEDPANETSADTEVADAFEGAAIKVKAGASVTFTGTGTLTADGSDCKNGIKGGSTASVTVGKSASDTFTLNVTAANNGLASDGTLVINGGTVNVTSGEDGIKASPDEDDTDSLGTVTINGGTVTVTSGNDGVQADKGFTMTGGALDITAAGGYKYNSQIEAADISAKGIKSDSSITISGGTVTIDSADDGIHLNGTAGDETVLITGGDLTIKSGDDGIHSDYYLTIGDGTGEPSVTVEQSCEGLEGAVIQLKSGRGSIYSTDDGVNAANSDLSSYKFLIDISGGSWYIDAGGDGLDSNGDINVTGGYTEVYGSSQGDNAALDYGDNNASFTVTGGTIVGVGMSNMATTPTSGTYVAFGSSGMGGQTGGPGQMGGRPGQQSSSGVSISKGTSIQVKDSQGNVIWSGTGTKGADNLVLSSEDLTQGETYYLYLNGTQVTSAAATAGSGQTSQGPGGQGGQQPGGPGWMQGYTCELTFSDCTDDPDTEGLTMVFTDAQGRQTQAMVTDQGITAQLMAGTAYTLTVSKPGLVTRTYQVPADTKSFDTVLRQAGDMNADGTLDVSDWTILKGSIQGILILDDDYDRLVADVDGSGETDVSDTTALKAIITGLVR